MRESTLRAAEPRDAEGLRDLYAEPSTYAGTLQLPYPSIELWRERLAQRAPGTTLLVAERGGRVIGSAALIRSQRERAKATSATSASASAKPCAGRASAARCSRRSSSSASAG